jgi:hypothetical protein
MKNKITETDWENVIDAEIDINSACSNFTKTFLNIDRDVLLDRASKCVGLFIILTNPLMTRMH